MAVCDSCRLNDLSRVATRYDKLAANFLSNLALATAITQNGVERELTIDEALEWQTYQAALKGSRIAIRQVLKMIEKRELALAKLNSPRTKPVAIEIEHCSDNADEAMRLLEILGQDLTFGQDHPRWKICTWATQAALSRPGRRRFNEKDVSDIKLFTLDPEKLKWPRGAAS